MPSAETLATITAAVLLSAVTLIPYLLRYRAAERKAREKLKKTDGTELNVPPVLHPNIDATNCIGCGSCIKACPEGDVIGMIGGKATLVHASKCVGHALCAEHCPVGAITMKIGSPGSSVQLPVVREHFESNISGMYIVGELGGMGLIKNALRQGSQAMDHIASVLQKQSSAEYDVIVVGAGPAGLAATLAAKKHNLRYLTLEQGDIGGTILQYPRRKIVMTSPVELPLYGKLKITETSKESLLELWETIITKTGVQIQTNERVLHIEKDSESFYVQTVKGQYAGQFVVLGIGRRGTPRKLGVPGEQLSKVTYRLIEAETYQNSQVLVVGGGDSAVEAAVALASQGTNRVTLSYRKGEFSRIKERNFRHLEQEEKSGRLNVMFHSSVREIREDSIVLEAGPKVQEIPNDYVFVFAGGEMPFDFLKKIGIELQSQALS